MKTKIIILMAVLLIGAFFLLRGDTGGSDLASESEDPSSALPNASDARTFALSEIASHKDAESCYTAIDGSIYDLTKWIEAHPGGAENILILCGKDGTKEFSEQHGTNNEAIARLASFKIGTLE